MSFFDILILIFLSQMFIAGFGGLFWTAYLATKYDLNSDDATKELLNIKNINLIRFLLIGLVIILMFLLNILGFIIHKIYKTISADKLKNWLIKVFTAQPFKKERHET